MIPLVLVSGKKKLTSLFSSMSHWAPTVWLMSSSTDAAAVSGNLIEGMISLILFDMLSRVKPPRA